jgi:hypothetical protein
MTSPVRHELMNAQTTKLNRKGSRPRPQVKIIAIAKMITKIGNKLPDLAAARGEREQAEEKGDSVCIMDHR